MSKSAFSAKIFSIYSFVVGGVFVVALNFLLPIFGIPLTSEVWIHAVGITAFMIDVYAWVAAKHENRSFLEASVYTRFVVFMALATFAVVDLGSPMLVLFGVADLLGGVGTHFALKADVRLDKTVFADQRGGPPFH